MKITVDIPRIDIKKVKEQIEKLGRRKLKSSLKEIGIWWLSDLHYKSTGVIDDPEDFVDLK